MGCSRAQPKNSELWNEAWALGGGACALEEGCSLPSHVQGAGAPLPASSWLASRVQGECVAVVVVCEKTEKNGEYSINCKWKPGSSWSHSRGSPFSRAWAIFW